jgi:hypothetical protein
VAGNDRGGSAKQPDADATPLPAVRDEEAGQPDGMWRPRRLAAFAVRAVAIGGPILIGTLTARLVSQLFDVHASIWLVSMVALGSAIGVATVLARIGARLLPLAVLLRMTMLFPDQAPNRIKVARRATSRDELARRLAHPDSDVREAATTLLALVIALGRHDRKTRGHSERVRRYCDLIGTGLGLTESERGRLRWAALLHDIGKLEVAGAVLNKPGKLTSTEWESVRTHPDAGAKLVAPLAEWLGPWFAGIGQHHEHFDGSGYPKGLAGEHISVAGRAVAVADAFATMTTARSYKSPVTAVAARAELARCAGTHFDPNMVRAFLTIALPRLLWAMGPVSFLVNVPFLRWIPASSVRAADVAAGLNTAAGALGVTAVTVVAATVHTPVIQTHGSAPARPVMAASTARQLSRTPHGALPRQPGGTDQGSGVVQLPGQPGTIGQGIVVQPGTSVDAAGSAPAGTGVPTTEQGGVQPDGTAAGTAPAGDAASAGTAPPAGGAAPAGDTAPAGDAAPAGAAGPAAGSGSSPSPAAGTLPTSVAQTGAPLPNPGSPPDIPSKGPIPAPQTSTPPSSGSGSSGSGSSGSFGSSGSGSAGSTTGGSGTSGSSGGGSGSSGGLLGGLFRLMQGRTP